MASLATDVDVVVIGGGFAGLACARALVRAGHTCVVLEARHRVGGRSLSVPCAAGGAGAMVDLGGQWVGPGQPLALQLIDELNLTPKLVRQAWFDDPPPSAGDTSSSCSNTPGGGSSHANTTSGGSKPTPTNASLNSGTGAAMSLADTADLSALVADVEREAEAAEANAAAWAAAAAASAQLGGGSVHAAAATASLAAGLAASLAAQDALSVGRRLYVQNTKPYSPTEASKDTILCTLIFWLRQQVADWLRAHACGEAARKELSLLVQTVLAAEPGDVSWLAFLAFVRACGGQLREVGDGDGGAQTFKLAGGSQQVAVDMAKELAAAAAKVVTGARAESVIFGPAGIATVTVRLEEK